MDSVKPHSILKYINITVKGPCPLSRFVPRPYLLTGVVGQSQPSVGREGTDPVRWPVSNKSVSTVGNCSSVPPCPFDVRQEKRLSGHGPLSLH